jgi:DNA-binding transcriptional ArsR family regulator
MAYTEVFTALADPTRRHIFEALLDSPKTVTELAANETVSRPAVSQHLRVLESPHLVGVERRGNYPVYSIKKDGLVDLREYLDRFWSDVLSA